MFIRGRSKRVLALILSASMIFTAYSTSALADEDSDDIVIEESADEAEVDAEEADSAEEDSVEESAEEQAEENTGEESAPEEDSGESAEAPAEEGGGENSAPETTTPEEGTVPADAAAPTDAAALPTEAAPTDGTTTPTDGTIAPADGTTTPTDGTIAPADGTTTPTDGAVAPADGTTTPTDGTVAPADGTTTPEDGQTPDTDVPSDNTAVSENDSAPVDESSDESKETVSDPDAGETVSDPDAADTTSENDVDEDDETVSDDEAKSEIKSFDTVETENFKVTISYHEDLIPEGVTVSVKEYDEDSDVYKSSSEKLEDSSVSFDGMVPLDISLIDKDDKEFEPEKGAIENVSIESKTTEDVKEAFSDAEADSLKVVHLEKSGNSEKAVVVADTENKSDGNVDITFKNDEDGQKVQKIKADFATDSFSTYVVVWRKGTNVSTYIGFVAASEKYQSELDELLADVDYEQIGLTKIDGKYYAFQNTLDFSSIAEIDIPDSEAKYVLRCVAGKYNNDIVKSNDFTVIAKNNENFSGKRIYYNWRPSGKDTKITYKPGTKDDPGIQLYYLRTVPTIDRFDDRGKGFHMFMMDWDGKQYEDGAYGDGSTKTGLYTLTTKGSGEDYEKFPQRISNGESIEKYVKGNEVYGLFREDKYDTTSYYYYKSTETAAELDTSTNNFTVFEELITPKAGDYYFYKRGNFLPYNQIDPTKIRHYNTIDEDGQSMDTGAEKYNWPIYGTMEDSTDYEFGFYGYGYFWQPIDGQVSINGVMEDMVYDFVGDDDLLIYIDGTLALDLGGIHDAQNGTINFATGEIVYTDTPTGSATVTKKTTLKAAFEAAGTANLVEWDSDKPTFKDGSQHLIQMFYMERGAGASNLNLKFNLPTVPKGSINVSKYMEQENAEKIKQNESYKFKLYVDGEAYADKPYTLAGAGSTEYKTDSDGCFSVKPNQVATFSGIDYDSKVRVEEISSDDDFKAQYIIEDNKGNQTIYDADTDWYITPADATHVRVKVDNVFKESKLKITKNFIVNGVSKNEAPDPNEFKNAKFLVQYSNDNGETWGDLKTINYSDFSVSDNSYTVSQAIIGVKYRVVELIAPNDVKENSDSYYASVDGGTRRYPYVNTIAGSNNGNVISSEISVDEEDKVYEVPFVNEYGKACRSLIVKKVVSGNKEYMDLGQKFDFTINLTESDGTGLAGTYGQTTYADGVSANSTVTFEDGSTNVSLGDGDYVVLTGIPVDTQYVITEDTGSLPDGYTLITGSEDMEGTLDEDKTVTVVNEFYFPVPTGAHLPGAGAQGTAASAGLILISGAALMLIDRKRRSA